MVFLRKFSQLRGSHCAKLMMISTLIAVINTSISEARPTKKIRWSDTPSGLNLSNRLNQDFTFDCSSGGQVSTIYGTDIYTSDTSICTAAAHSGIITVRDGGNVTIRIKGGSDFYNGTNQNEISSSGYGKWGSSFIFLNQNGQPIVTKAQIKIISWGDTPSGLNLSGRLGQKFTFTCRRNGQIAGIYGTNLYTSDSSICTAAVHRGIISSKNGGNVTIIIRGGSDSYEGSTRNGVKSSSYGSWGGSFSFVSAGD
jgi:hypothetical protein